MSLYGHDDRFEALVIDLCEYVALGVGRGVGDVLYGLSLEYGTTGLSAYCWPLYEVTRVGWLAAGDADPLGLWDASWAPMFGLPAGVGSELPDRDLEVGDFDDELISRFREFVGMPVASQQAMERLVYVWLATAARLTGLEWDRYGVEVTDDFVCIATPIGGDRAAFEIRPSLEASLGPERYAELVARGWVPK